MIDTLLTTTGTKTRAYLLGAAIRVIVADGTGTLRYLTVCGDGHPYAGIQLDGERAAIEVPIERVEVRS